MRLKQNKKTEENNCLKISELNLRACKCHQYVLISFNLKLNKKDQLTGKWKRMMYTEVLINIFQKST